MKLYSLISSWHWLSCLRHAVSYFIEDASRINKEILFDEDYAEVMNIFIKDLESSNYTVVNEYTRASMVTLKIVLQSGYEEDMYESAPKMLLTLFIMVGGWIYTSYMLVLVSNVMMAAESSETKFETITRQVNAFCKSKQLSQKLTEKIKTFFNYKFQKNYFNEEAIQNSTSASLRKEITMHSCAHLIAKVQLFKDLPQNLIENIVLCLTMEIFFTNDIIIQADSMGDAMYFIAFGTAAVYAQSGKLLSTVADGSHFGEISLLKAQKRNATVKALEMCEVYKLSQKDFRNVIEPHPDLLQKMEIIALLRMNK